MKGNLVLELIGKKNIMASFIWDISDIVCINPEEKGTWETIDTGDSIISIKVRYCNSNPDNLKYCQDRGLELYIAQYGI